MEKRIQKLKLILIFNFLFFVSVFSGLFAQTPSVIEHIRFPLWAELDAYPGLEEAKEDLQAGEYDYPLNSIKKIAPFIMDGMVYGWNFVYVPSDKARNVEEYFEVTVIENLEKTGGVLTYSSPWFENNRFNCWIDYSRTEFQIQNYYLWASIQHPTIQGRGYGDLADGFEGIKAASQDALKNAVRKYYQNTIKNKPREITGSVLVRKIPTIGIDAGRYVVNLDFFLERGKIKEYTQF